jgi:hypothetical protein
MSRSRTILSKALNWSQDVIVSYVAKPIRAPDLAGAFERLARSDRQAGPPAVGARDATERTIRAHE